MPSVGNRSKYRVMSHMQESGRAVVSFTTVNGANPVSLVDKGAIVATAVRDGEGSIVVTLNIRAVKLWCFPNIRSTGDTKVAADAIVEGTNVVNSVAITTTLATAADDVPGAVVDLLLEWTNR